MNHLSDYLKIKHLQSGKNLICWHTESVQNCYMLAFNYHGKYSAIWGDNNGNKESYKKEDFTTFEDLIVAMLSFSDLANWHMP